MLKAAGHCTLAKRMTSILRHIAGTFPPVKLGAFLNSHRVIGIATNTSKLRLSDQHNDDSRCRDCRMQFIVIPRDAMVGVLPTMASCVLPAIMVV